MLLLVPDKSFMFVLRSSNLTTSVNKKANRVSRSHLLLNDSRLAPLFFHSFGMKSTFGGRPGTKQQSISIFRPEMCPGNWCLGLVLGFGPECGPEFGPRFGPGRGLKRNPVHRKTVN